MRLGVGPIGLMRDNDVRPGRFVIGGPVLGVVARGVTLGIRDTMISSDAMEIRFISRLRNTVNRVTSSIRAANMEVR